MPLQMFICNRCGSSYKSMREAEICEARHIDIDKIHSAYWTFDDYPTNIVIEMKDGAKVHYGKYREDLI